MTHRLIVGGELVLYGPVGIIDFWDDTGFTAADVLNALAEMSGDITVRLNSGGGIAMEGSAIYNALKRHDGAVSMIVDGIAASAASVIAMAGDTIDMPLGSLMMIHEPAGVTIGTADNHRKTADVLDTMTDLFAQLYADRTGQPESAIRDTMKTETWLDPKAAVDKGFATSTSEGGAATADASFDYSTYRKAPAALKRLARNRQAESLPMVAIASASPKPKGKEPKMANPAPSADPKPTAANPAPAPAPTPAPAPVVAADNSMAIFNLCAAARLDMDAAAKIMDEAGNSLDKTKDLIIARFTADDPEKGEKEPVATVIADMRDKFKEGAKRGLLARAGFDAKAGGERNEFTGMTLGELARESLTRAGVKITATDRMAMVGAALGMPSFIMAGQQSTSDFAEVLANTANKSMLKGWDETPETFDQWTSRGTLGDFKSAKRVDLNTFPSLRKVPEGAEYKYISLTDRGESIILATYGEIFPITRQAIINDDLGVFTRVPMKMGRAARRTIGDLVYAVLTDNGALSDGVALFHADHNNLASSGGAPSVTTLSAARAAMALQTDPDGNVTALNIRPAYFLVPVELESDAKILMNNEFDPAKTQRSTNSVRNMATVISDARLSADSAAKWYLAADPMINDTIEVSYLNGNANPVLERQDGWKIDGVEFKVRQDTGVAPLDYHGLYQNPGS